MDFGNFLKKRKIRRQTFCDAREISPLSPPNHAEITRKSPPSGSIRCRFIVYVLSVLLPKGMKTAYAKLKHGFCEAFGKFSRGFEKTAEKRNAFTVIFLLNFRIFIIY